MYVLEPVIVHINTLSDEYLQKWSKPYEFYDGEECYRYVYASYNDFSCKPVKVVYKLSSIFAESINKLSFEQEQRWRCHTLGMQFLEAKRTEDDR